MSLDSADWEKINGCLLRLYRELDAEKHTQVMFQVVDELVPDGCIALDNFNAVTKEIRTDTLPVNFATEEDKKWIARYIHQSPLAPYFAATPDPEWKTITDFMPLEDFQQTELHRLGFTRINVNHQIFGLLAQVPPMIYVIVVNRTDRGFTERERTLLNTIHPHLVTSFLNAQKFTQAVNTFAQLEATMNAAPGAYGYFTADRKLSWLQPRAQQWIENFFITETRGNSGLPRSLQNLVEAAGKTPLHLENANAIDRLTACLLPSVLGGWILRLDRKPLTPQAHFRPLAQLTPRENEVLSWMVQGKRNAEIASILTTSSRTVEKQVQSILTKLEVEHRAAAILRAMELAASQNHPA